MGGAVAVAVVGHDHDEEPVLRVLDDLPGHQVACHWAEQVRSGELQPASAAGPAAAADPVGSGT